MEVYCGSSDPMVGEQTGGSVALFEVENNQTSLPNV